MRFKIKSWRLWLLISLGVGLLSIPLAYVLTTRGSAYAEAERFLKSSPQLVAEIGEVKYLRLAYFGFQEKEVNDEGDADLPIVVTGAQDSGNAFVHLERANKTWRVVRSNFTSSSGKMLNLVP